MLYLIDFKEVSRKAERKNMARYINYNANPKGRKTDDCVVRALTFALKLPYEEVLKELYETQLKTGYCLLGKRVYERVLANHGFVKMKQPRHLDGRKYLVGEIDLLTRKRCVVSMANHLTAAEDGFYYDTWDCRRKCIGNYYVKG